MRTTGNTVVITGGASGIGLAIARELVQLQNNAIVLGRNIGRLESAKAQVPGLHTIVCDVTDEGSIRRAMERIVAEHPGFNILLNAAGTSRACRFAEDDGAIELARAEINTNLLGTVMATKLALPHLLKQNEAAVVTISSGIAIAPHYGEPTHSASKAALHAFCRCLRAQLKGTSVKVFEVMPPLTDTALTKNVKGKKIRPEDVAKALIRGIARDSYEIHVGIVKALAFLVRLSPALAARIVTDSAR
jgi:short-subunit dehydrogenase involved in D-alanine esterification of teichoic acids